MALKLTQLAAKPQLIRIELNDEETIKEFGDSIEFWIWDRQPIDKFVRMATMKADDFGSLIEAVNDKEERFISRRLPVKDISAP